MNFIHFVKQKSYVYIFGSFDQRINNWPKTKDEFLYRPPYKKRQRRSNFVWFRFVVLRSHALLFLRNCTFLHAWRCVIFVTKLYAGFVRKIVHCIVTKKKEKCYHKRTSGGKNSPLPKVGQNVVSNGIFSGSPQHCITPYVYDRYFDKP